MRLNPLDSDTLARLENLLGKGGLLGAEPRYLSEPRDLYHGNAAAVARPRTVEEVAAILSLCNENHHPVVPFGGGTGLVGGQVSSETPAPLIVSLERMNSVRRVDPQDNILVAEAGVTLSEAREAADAVNRLFPLSLASEGSCCIGGNLATNAGGVNVLRYGNARDLCLGVEAVLPSGEILRGLKGLRKDNTGYDLRDLLVGSEGTLAIITAADLRLFPKPDETVAAFLSVPSPVDALTLLRRLQETIGDVVSAFELIHHNGLDFLTEGGFNLKSPLAAPSEWSVLVDCGSSLGSNLTERLENALMAAFEDGLVLDAAVSQSETQRAAFWNIRETIPLGNRKVGAISSHDISVCVGRVPAFLEQGALAVHAIAPELRINAFGHLGDGNLHFNIFPPKGRAKSEYQAIRGRIIQTVHDLVHEFDGSVSAEHGIGRAKTADLRKYSDPTKYAAMRAIKSALDPNGIMNPGAIFPMETD